VDITGNQPIKPGHTFHTAPCTSQKRINTWRWGGGGQSQKWSHNNIHCRSHGNRV